MQTQHKHNTSTTQATHWNHAHDPTALRQDQNKHSSVFLRLRHLQKCEIQGHPTQPWSKINLRLPPITSRVRLPTPHAALLHSSSERVHNHHMDIFMSLLVTTLLLIPSNQNCMPVHCQAIFKPNFLEALQDGFMRDASVNGSQLPQCHCRTDSPGVCFCLQLCHCADMVLCQSWSQAMTAGVVYGLGMTSRICKFKQMCVMVVLKCTKEFLPESTANTFASCFFAMPKHQASWQSSPARTEQMYVFSLNP